MGKRRNKKSKRLRRLMASGGALVPVTGDTGLAQWEDLDTADANDAMGLGPVKGNKDFGPCRDSHKEFELGGGVIHGGSCLSPLSGYDIYVGLDKSSLPLLKPYPWQPAIADLPVEVLFSIPDMHIPADTHNFVKMIAWLKEQLAIGKRIHVGCIGGHGRTGMVLAALYKEVTGEVDAVKVIRAKYCKSAVETTSQMQFLTKHFGIKAAEIEKHKSYGYGDFQGINSGYGYSLPSNFKVTGGTEKGYKYGVFPITTSKWRIWEPELDTLNKAGITEDEDDE